MACYLQLSFDQNDMQTFDKLNSSKSASTVFFASVVLDKTLSAKKVPNSRFTLHRLHKQRTKIYRSQSGYVSCSSSILMFRLAFCNDSTTADSSDWSRSLFCGIQISEPTHSHLIVKFFNSNDAVFLSKITCDSTEDLRIQ